MERENEEEIREERNKGEGMEERRRRWRESGKGGEREVKKVDQKKR